MLQRKSVWQFLKSTVIQWLEDRPFQLASSLSYYTIFSLAPLLVIVIAIAGFAFGEAAAEQRIVGTIQGMIGEDSARAVQTMIENASRQPKTGIISAAMGFLALLLGAGGVVGQLQTSLNTIWGVEPKPGQGVRGFLRQRFLSLAMVMGIGFLLLVSLIISAAITGLSRFIGRFVTLAYALDVVVSLLLITTLFAMIYKFLPDVRIRWRDVWIGGLLTAVLFTIGKFLIALYLGRSGVSSTFGAAASLITILLWVYYSSLIFFLGAEFTQVYATWYGSGVSPAAHAEPIGATRKRQTPPPEMRSVPGRSSTNEFPQT